MKSTPKTKKVNTPTTVSMQDQNGDVVEFKVSPDTVVIVEMLKQQNQLLAQLCSFLDPRAQAALRIGNLIKGR